MDKPTVYIVAATRSPIGRFGGSLKDTSPIMLATEVAESAVARSGLGADHIQHVVIGHVIHSEGRDMYLPRVVAQNIGLAVATPAVAVNRLCGSGMQAIISACNMIMLGDAEVVLAGGVEVMSRGGYLLDSYRWGRRTGAGQVHDMMLAALTDPFGHGHMGMTAEYIADAFAISRKTQDAWAAQSQARAVAAQNKGLFAQETTPITLADAKTKASKTKPGKQKPKVFAEDEHIRPDADLAQLGTLKPVFREGGSVTAGNAAGINDGASMLILASEEAVKRHNLKPLGRVVGYGYGGVKPEIMGMGPVPATRMALARCRLTVADLAVVESNEAFAAQVCAVNKELGLPADKVNITGGAIALGHPIGATGAVITTKLIYQLNRLAKDKSKSKGKASHYGLATMCIGGGQGISLVLATI